MEHDSILPIDTQISHYRIVRVIGRGGFGITYEGWDGSLNRRVAIKEYFPQGVAVRLADGIAVRFGHNDEALFTKGLERFLDEARALAQFHDPRIVRVHGFIQEFGTAYMIMDFESGPSLREVVLAKGCLTALEARATLIELLHGMKAIHERSYLHRDIKPANIIRRDNGEIVLLDFGSARIAQAQAQGDQNYTVMVTPGYAPIEQYDANGQQGPATDLYSLGATMVFCLTGQSPPDGLKRAIAMQQNAPDPVAAILAAVVKRTPTTKALCDVVQWLMQPLVDQRPQRAVLVLEMLANATTQPNTQTAPAPPALSSIRSIPATSVEPMRAFQEAVIGNEATPLLFAAIRKARNAQEVIDQVLLKVTDAALQERVGAGLGQLLGAAVASQERAAPGGAGARPPIPNRSGTKNQTPVDEASKQIITAELAKHIGPIAGMLVTKGIAKCQTRAELVTMLEEEITDADDRAAFRKALARLPAAPA